MSTPAPEARPVAVPLKEVERELDRQLRAAQGSGDKPVQRVRMSNLVIYCAGPEQAAQVEGQVPDVVAAHPARVLLLVPDPGAAANLTAEVLVRPVGNGHVHHACVEQVTLRAGDGCVYRLPFAVRALVIGDLPTNLWWAAPQPPPFAGTLLYELAEHAQQIVYDSIGWPDPARGVAATAGWLEQVERQDVSGRWRVASDLNWRRLKYWRRLLVQALESASAPGAAESATEVLVEHGPHAVVQAWELVSWLTLRLGWRVQAGKVSDGTELSWRFCGPRGDTRVRIRRLAEGPPEVRRVRVACTLDGKPCALNLVIEDGRRLAVLLEGIEAAPRTMTLPPSSAAELVGKQLSDRERDPVFHESMAVAQVMAQSVLH
ncbi:MAG TPA: glucose-6-phosphate dehydrogenase assembly protein OpcA [Gemmataceae bacterium]|jgi:glucose-6-phosphate dehydrogenase assembly protein OpcA|nr:glucose-6-phosphate dehydrogenase assembly protein OpcA [Gemmataceae bacterium]